MLKILFTGIAISTLALGSLGAFAAATEPAKMGTTSMGKVWVDAKGMTLYTFDKDKADKSACNDKCATEWPPFMVADGATATGEWTIVVRDDATKMWAYDGHPLYTFLDDKKAGDATGDGKDGFHLAK